ncbi:MAG: FitA-like ribbon-helix-helix domain-containing protein [Lentimonas sp.]
MKSIHIRNLDDKVVQGLKQRAARHRRSLQKEVEVLLEDAARMSPPEEDSENTPKFKLNVVSTGQTSSTWSREEIYSDDGR